MQQLKKHIVEHDSWQSLKAFTAARIALGKTGISIPLKETLQFRLAHAHARDAVYSTLQETELLLALQQFNLPIHVLHSQAKDRQAYLQRPDFGRLLSGVSQSYVRDGVKGLDIAIVLADGLSATAINKHAIPLLQLLMPLLQHALFSISSISLVHQARVAIGDEIGQLLNSKLSLVLIGERPGLSSPDSMGAYLTYQPTVGLTDEKRNCISNIRTEGLSYQAAALKLFYLMKESLRLQLSGIGLKDGTSLLT